MRDTNRFALASIVVTVASVGAWSCVPIGPVCPAVAEPAVELSFENESGEPVVPDRVEVQTPEHDDTREPACPARPLSMAHERSGEFTVIATCGDETLERTVQVESGECGPKLEKRTLTFPDGACTVCPAGDAGSDAGDAGEVDARSDSGTSGGTDAGFDIGVDSGTDATVDAGSDSGGEAGFDAGIDGSVDAGADVGGPDVGARVDGE